MKLKNLFILSVLALTFAACKGSVINENLATAPKDMTGKTMKIDGATIQFSSNTSATISNYIGTANQASVSYKRTSEITAHLNFFYHAEDKNSMSERRYDLDLTFADKTQGLASGSYTYKLTIHKGTKYETSDSGSQTVKDKIFSVK